MADFRLREYHPSDIPRLVSLWHRVFGDSEALAARFLELLPQMGTGVVADLDGCLAGSAYIVDGLELVQADGSVRPCAYLYAVAVEADHRGLGLGASITEAAADLGRSRGASFVCTLPANRSLYSFYEKHLGARCALRREKRSLWSKAGASVVSVNADVYLQKREQLLQGRCHMRLSPAAMAFEQSNCLLSGGGLYTVGDAIAAAYVDDSRCILRELLCPPGCSRDDLAAAVGSFLRTDRITLYTAALVGEPYLSAPVDCLPADCVWDLAFD